MNMASSSTNIFIFLALLLLYTFPCPHASSREYQFFVKEASYSRLCETKKILTVNGQFPGPTIYAYRGETIYVEVYNGGNYNITIHWHGVKQPRNPWSDGPAYITQCPIQPGRKFRQKVIFSNEEGTLWWHAHSDWSRATVHGAIVVYPRPGTTYPFPLHPHHRETPPIILGEWWKRDVMEVLEEFVHSGGIPTNSDAFTINGQPGDLYPCSKPGTFRLNVEYGKSYLLRLVGATMSDILFFSIADHKLIVVGADGSYTKPLTTEYVVISPGQTLDCLLHANQPPNRTYYMAARAYSTIQLPFDNTTTTGILAYININTTTKMTPLGLGVPPLPYYNDTNAAFNFFGALRSLVSKEHPLMYPLTKKKKTSKHKLFSTISINTFTCPPNNSCDGPNGTRLAASMNNISFAAPPVYDILRAYYNSINGIFDDTFPRVPPFPFDFTGENLPASLQIPSKGTKVKVVKYNSLVEIVLQNTNLVQGLDHPMHIHGYSFHVVGWGFGNFDRNKDPAMYNLEDPVLLNTVTVPKNGWAVIRFKANNPGVWFVHCHLERHLTWGMATVLIVRDGKRWTQRMLPPPPYMPPC